jgi:hypothetical protein
MARPQPVYIVPPPQGPRGCWFHTFLFNFTAWVLIPWVIYAYYKGYWSF